MQETYGIAGTCPTDSPDKRITVRIVEEPILSNKDAAEEPILQTKESAEQPSVATEDATLLRSATGSLSLRGRCAAMGPSNSEDAEDGKGCSTTGVVTYLVLVAAGAPPVD